MENETYMKRLKDRLQIEFKNRIEGGVYGYNRGTWRIIQSIEAKKPQQRNRQQVCLKQELYMWMIQT